MLTHPGLTGAFTGSTIVASIGLSGFPAWVAVITMAGSLFGLAALRSTAFLWRGERDAEKAKAERLEETLALEREAHRATQQRLAVSEEKPDIEKLYDLMRAHDTRMAGLAAETTKVLAEVSAGLRENTQALQLWATQQAQHFER